MWFRDTWYNYFKAEHSSVNMQFNPDCWTKSLKLYWDKKYKESFLELLKYTNKKIKNFQTSENVFRIPHWSIFVDIDFSGSEIKISSDFLDVSSANKVPLFRRIVELNFSLNLTQIKYSEDKFKFDFSCDLELYDPYKMFDILSEICYFSDKFDEEFCEQFWAKNISEASVKEIPDNKKEIIYKNFKDIISSNMKIIEDLESRRRNNYAWDVISTTYKMIDYTCAPKGSLALRISENVAELYNRDQSLETIIFRWKEFLKDISEMPKEDFFKNLYETEQFIPNKKVATKEQIAEYLRPGYSDAYQDLQSGDFESAYLIFMHILYNSMYYHIMPVWMEKAIVKAIKTGSNSPVNQMQVWVLSWRIAEIINLQNIPSNSTNFFSGLLVFIWWIIAWIIMSMFGN